MEVEDKNTEDEFPPMNPDNCAVHDLIPGEITSSVSQLPAGFEKVRRVVQRARRAGTIRSDRLGPRDPNWRDPSYT